MTLPRKLLSLIALFLFASLAVYVWQEQNHHERELVIRHTNMTSQQIKVRIEGLMNARMACLNSLAFRWLERTPPDFSQNRFMGLAGSFYTHFPGFTGINWIDPEGGVRWVYPENLSQTSVDKRHFPLSELFGRYDLEEEENELKYSTTACMEMGQGGVGFHTFWPLVYEGKLQGYLNGVFQISQIVAICLPEVLLNDFSIRLYEGKQLIYSNGKAFETDPLEKDGLDMRQTIRFYGKTWELALAPKASVYVPGKIQNPSLLAFGLVISVILSMLLYFLLQRMQAYREARDQALKEAAKRKMAEAALKQNEKRLEALVGELANKNTELETFVYSVSHDLKTPIVTIEGYAGALWEDFGGVLPEDGKKYLNYIEDASRKMDLLIKDLLDLSRVGRLKIRKTEFPLNDLIENTLDALQTQIKNSGVEIRVQEDLPMVYGEKKRLAQVMENLLINAIKYMGKENQKPCIDIGSIKKDHDPVFFVRDNGIGIEKKHFDQIFQAFQRLPVAKQIGEGTGLGLSIVKRIIEYHGGRIWVESFLGKGTTFFFTLKNKEGWTDEI